MTPVIPPSNPVESYLDQAARLIGTNATNDFVSGPLHDTLRKHFFNTITATPPAPGEDVLTGNRGQLNSEGDLEAPLAVAGASERPRFFASNKFSTVQLLLRAVRVAQAEAEGASPDDIVRANAFKRLMLVDNCYVTRLERLGDRITKVFYRPAEYNCVDGVFSRSVGPEASISLPENGRVFLGAGTIENTRFVLNSVPENPRVGRNLMAHLRSNFTFRVPRGAFPGLDPNQEPDPVKRQRLRELQVSALFIKGIHTHADGSKGHYHLQITASGVGELGLNSEAELFKKIPNIDELDQFTGLTDQWVVITLRGIGEMVGDKSADPQNRVTRGAPDGNNVPRARVRLETNWSNPNDPRVTDPNDPTRTKDNDLWKAMDDVSRKLASSFAALGPVQYLSRPNDPDNAHWSNTPPPRSVCQDTLSSTHHEAGTLWMDDSAATSVTDPIGRVWELKNCYVVGPAVLPTIGSPNPMLSGVALARRTADRIATLPPVAAPEVGFKWLFDGRVGSFGKWRRVGPGGFALRDGAIIAQPRGDHSILYYSPERFDNFFLRLQFRLPGPVDEFGKVIGNSGVYVRSRQPHTQWADVNQIEPKAAGNPAWVAAVTGFQIQLDEQGKNFYYNKNRTGAIYDIPAGDVVNGVQEPQEQNFTPFAVLQPGQWYEYEIQVQNDTYTVRMGSVVESQNTNFQQVTSFSKPQGKYTNRGLSPSADPHSGYIAVQAHTGAVAFRSIRIRPL